MSEQGNNTLADVLVAQYVMNQGILMRHTDPGTQEQFTVDVCQREDESEEDRE